MQPLSNRAKLAVAACIIVSAGFFITAVFVFLKAGRLAGEIYFRWRDNTRGDADWDQTTLTTPIAIVP